MNKNSFFIICLVVSFFVFGQGITSHTAQAAVGDSCAKSSDCVQPSTCHKGVCTGPCDENLDCQTGSFLNTIGWANSVCLGNSANPNVCVEAAREAIPKGPQSGAALIALVKAITDWIFAIFLIVATIFIILAALQFLTGGGEPAQVSAARMKLLWAVVAIIVAAMAEGIPTVIRSIMET